MSIGTMELTKAGAPVDGVNELLTLFSGKNTKQSVAITGTPTGGTFTLTFNGHTTGDIAYNADAAAVKAALVALDDFVTGDINATGGSLPGAAVVLEFQAAYAATEMGGTDVPLLTADGTGLTGGTAPAVEVTQTQGNPSGGTFTLSLGGQTTAALDHDISPTDLQTALEGLSTIGTGNVTCNGAAALFEEEQTITFVGDLGGLDVDALTADDTNLVSPQGTGEACTSITETNKGVRGDYRGCPIGSTLIDTTNCLLYKNTGAAISTPVWTEWAVT
jgi:trimeric autotransporter adhesin